jgi:hypothetical protein
MSCCRQIEAVGGERRETVVTNVSFRSLTEAIVHSAQEMPDRVASTRDVYQIAKYLIDVAMPGKPHELVTFVASGYFDGTSYLFLKKQTGSR